MNGEIRRESVSNANSTLHTSHTFRLGLKIIVHELGGRMQFLRHTHMDEQTDHN